MIEQLPMGADPYADCRDAINRWEASHPKFFIAMIQKDQPDFGPEDAVKNLLIGQDTLTEEQKLLIEQIQKPSFLRYVRAQFGAM